MGRIRNDRRRSGESSVDLIGDGQEAVADVPNEIPS
jgi:hypothetical protein